MKYLVLAFFVLCLVAVMASAQPTEQEVNEALIVCSQAKSEAAARKVSLSADLTTKCDKVEALYRERVKVVQDRQKTILDKIK